MLMNNRASPNVTSLKGKEQQQKVWNEIELVLQPFRA
jgi:hypothetical protein